MACPTNLVPTPPPPTSSAVFPALPSPPAHYSIHCSSVLSRARSIGFKGPPSIQQEIEKSASGYRISVSSYPPPCRAFVRNSLIKRCQPLFPRQPYTVPLPLAVVGCDPSNLPISFFRQGAPISIVRATVAAVRPVNKTVRQSCTSHTARPKLSLDIVGRWFAESLNGMNRISNSL